MASIWHAKYSKMLLINSEARNVDAKILKFVSFEFFSFDTKKKINKMYFFTEIKNIA